MKLKPDGLPARFLQALIDRNKRDSRERPMTLFVGEKKQMWYFLMNQVDQTPPEQGGEGEDTGKI